MKTLKIAGIVLVVVLALGVLGVGFAFAQSATRMFWGGSGQNGSGMMGDGYGMMGRGSGMMDSYGQNGEDGDWMQGMDFMPAMHNWMTTTGGMHTLVWNSLAEALGLTPDELTAQFESGQTLAQIAEAQGVSQEQLAATLETAVETGLEQAVTDGILTQAQAEAMREHMDGNYAWMLAHMGSHMGPGTGAGSGGCHGNAAPQDNS